MGSPLGSVLADIHMGELECMLLPTLIEHVQDWQRRRRYDSHRQN